MLDKKPFFLLFSPGAVDAYPPVQYQARIIADAGFRVELITTTAVNGGAGVKFRHPGVTTSIAAGSGALSRNVSLFTKLCRARRRIGSGLAVEIDYDPVGVVLGGLAPCRPKKQIAHLHEYSNLRTGRTANPLRRLIHRSSEVVVPGHDRATLTQDLFGLNDRPTSIPNYPIFESGPFVDKRNSSGFKVVYCGSLGRSQQLHRVIEALPHWPRGASLVLIGSDSGPDAQSLKRQVRDLGLDDRVNFTGWMNLGEAEAEMATANLALAFLDDSSEQWRSALEASNKRFQYMKCSLPQIGDQNPGVPELLERNQIGRCLGVGGFDELPRLIKWYMDNPHEANEHGRRARSLFEKQFNYQAVFEDVLARWVSEWRS